MFEIFMCYNISESDWLNLFYASCSTQIWFMQVVQVEVAQILVTFYN